jgi:hypothetical protein
MRNLHIAIRGAVAAVVLSTSAVVLALTAAPAGAACGCPVRSSAAPAPSATVFQGTLTAVADPGLGQAGTGVADGTDLQYTFRVDSILSGTVDATVVVLAPVDALDCTTPMVVGRRYEVAARSATAGLELTGCAESAALGSDVLALGRNGASLTSDDGPDRFFVLGLAGLSLIAAVAVTVLAVDHVRRVRRSADALSADGLRQRHG